MTLYTPVESGDPPRFPSLCRLVGGCGAVLQSMVGGAGKLGLMRLSSTSACLLRKKSSTFSAKYTSWFVEPAGPVMVKKAAPDNWSPALSATEIFSFGWISSDTLMPILCAVEVPETHICAPVSARPRRFMRFACLGSGKPWLLATPLHTSMAIGTLPCSSSLVGFQDPLM